MLQNVYFLAKIGADTAENGRNFAPKNCQKELATLVSTRSWHTISDSGRAGLLRAQPRLLFRSAVAVAPRRAAGAGPEPRRRRGPRRQRRVCALQVVVAVRFLSL